MTINVLGYPIHIDGVGDPDSIALRKESEDKLNSLLNQGFNVIATQKVAYRGIANIVFFLYRPDPLPESGAQPYTRDGATAIAAMLAQWGTK